MVDSENPEDSTQASSRRLSDRTEGDCDGKCGPIVYEEADWKPGNPTGVYCQSCGHLFEWRGLSRP